MSVQSPVSQTQSPKSLESKKAVLTPEQSPDEFDTANFVEHFGVLADAEGAPNRLRDMVLDLAIRGKLTNPGFEAPPSEGTAPFGLPPGWRWSVGRDVFTLVTSGSRGWAQFYAGEGAIFLRIGNLDYRSIELDLRAIQRVQPPPNAEGTRTKVQPGDVLISITGDTGMVGLVPEGLGDAYINQHIALARPGPTVVPAYVARALTAPALLGRVQSAQRGIKNSLGLDDIRDLLLPIPPLPEQKRIVAKVDELTRLIDDLEAKQAKTRQAQMQLRRAALDALTSARGPAEFKGAWKRVAENFVVLFQRADSVPELRRAILEMGVRGALTEVRSTDEPTAALWRRISTERAEIMQGRRLGGRGKSKESEEPVDQPYVAPEGWIWCRLSDIAGHIVDGTHHTPTYVEKGMPFISAKDIKRGTLSFDDCKFISPEEFDELALRCRPKRGDVLVQKSGSIGEVAVVNTDRVFTLFESVALIPVVPSVDPNFVAHVTYLGASGRFGQEHQKGVGVTHLHLVDLRRLPFPLPPLEEQRRIVAKVEHLMKLCDDLEAKLRRSEETAAKLVEAVVADMVA